MKKVDIDETKQTKNELLESIIYEETVRLIIKLAFHKRT